jgi:hypothetical protein
MKFIKSLIVITTLFILNTANGQTITEKWTQLNDYQELISKIYHAAENGNLDAIKNNSQILVDHSLALTDESMPVEFRNPKVTESLVLLKKQTKITNDLVQKNASDNEIKKALKNLHTTFLKIVGL